MRRLDAVRRPTLLAAGVVGVLGAVGAVYPFGSLTISPAAPSALPLGRAVRLSATSRGVLGAARDAGHVRWSSATPAVAMVDARTGLVRAIAPGTATITARDGARHDDVDVTVLASPGATSPAPSAVAPDVTIDVRTDERRPISPYVYGINAATDAEGAPADAAPWYGATPPRDVTLERFGGNRLSTYNWETSYSNAGSDYNFQNDRYLSESAEPGAAVRERAVATFRRNPNAALLVTVPMLGYVAGDACGCNVGTTEAGLAARLAAHFKVSRPFKGAPLSLRPDTTDRVVYQDEFVNWVVNTFPGKPIFFSLDNEPDTWHGTHKEILSDHGDNPNTPRLQTYDGFAQTTIEYARAVKSVAPRALVFGPVTATWAGMAALGRYPSPDPTYGSQFFLGVYLDKLRQAETRYGRRLVDVLDVHWYPEVGTGRQKITDDRAGQDPAMIRERVQAPRSLWDPTYVERSWVADAAGGPIRLLPRLREVVAAHYPGTKIAISEYNYGRTGDISGGVAQADVLGIFGREEVFAAAFWPLANPYASDYGGSGAKAYAYAFGAFRMYLNYDGEGGRFGDTGLRTTTSDPATTSAYASLDAAGRVVIVAINKLGEQRVATFRIAAPTEMHGARVFTLTGASPMPQAIGTLTVRGNVLAYPMPPLSVSTIVLAP